MKSLASLFWTVFVLAVTALIGLAIWNLGAKTWVHLGIPPEHLLDWGMGVLCFLWLIVILKAPRGPVLSGA